jgi:uncharacterized protein
VRLLNQTKQTEVANVVIEASSFMQRLLGLLPQANLQPKCTMFFPGCNNIHTAFMRFPIDVIFVDRDLKVKSVKKNVTPFKLKFDFSAYSVFEMNSGEASAAKIEVGDQLNVVD